MPDTGLCARVACVWEATARKVGNVHRYCDFEDITYLDFIVSSAAIAPVMATACQRSVGATILEAIRATRQVVSTNTNLGMVLLLAPLAAVPEGEDLHSGVERVLARLDMDDARQAYEAIRLATPGGLGRVPEQDVAAEPTQTLGQVMALAADRDQVARQYANGYAEVFDGARAVMAGLEHTGSLEGAIVFAHLTLLARHPDTLIARKRGLAEAEEASARAREVLARRWPHEKASWAALAEFDAWLRAEGHQRNPGTSADLVTASLFVLLCQERIPLPSPWPWTGANWRWDGHRYPDRIS
jgi:triphosphoribosyl-dephospho-CoA synthase